MFNLFFLFRIFFNSIEDISLLLLLNNRFISFLDSVTGRMENPCCGHDETTWGIQREGSGGPVGPPWRSLPAGAAHKILRAKIMIAECRKLSVFRYFNCCKLLNGCLLKVSHFVLP